MQSSSDWIRLGGGAARSDRPGRGALVVAGAALLTVGFVGGVLAHAHSQGALGLPPAGRVALPLQLRHAGQPPGLVLQTSGQGASQWPGGTDSLWASMWKMQASIDALNAAQNETLQRLSRDERLQAAQNETLQRLSRDDIAKTSPTTTTWTMRILDFSGQGWSQYGVYFDLVNAGERALKVIAMTTLADNGTPDTQTLYLNTEGSGKRYYGISEDWQKVGSVQIQYAHKPFVMKLDPPIQLRPGQSVGLLLHNPTSNGGVLCSANGAGSSSGPLRAVPGCRVTSRNPFGSTYCGDSETPAGTATFETATAAGALHFVEA